MEAPHLERKLVAILAADIEGFSSHMERDESGTLTVLSNHRLIIDASIAEYGGRITSTAGDSVLAEFASVVSVINCAVQIQDLLADENAQLDEAERLFLRIGINVGDVMMKDGDIFGDGVNIAARLESLAEPGGICVSRGVRDHLRKHPIAFTDLGEQKVKNIAQPVRAFKVRMGEAVPDQVIDPVLEATRVDGPSMSPSSLGEDVGVEDVGIELAFWNSIKDSGSVAELEAYLARYPDGSFTVLAQTRRDALIAAEESDPVPAEADEEKVAIELAFWEAAKDSGSAIELEAYLERYPEGEFVELAQARLASLQEAATGAPSSNEEVTEGELTFWNSIQDSSSCIELQAYLERYPQGEFVQLAAARLETLQQASVGTAASNEEVTEGELTFWNSIKDSGNPDMFRAYLNKYPDGTYAELAQINIEIEGS
jgi:adenylate cyclase